VIIDRTIAARYWHDSTGAAALGKRVSFTKSLWYTVIGVVGAVHDTSLAAPPNSLVYVPDVPDADTLQSPVTRTIGLVARATGDPHSIIKSVQAAIAEVDPRLPPFGVSPMADIAEQSMARLSFVMTIVGVTAIVALALAAIGLYGVLAYIVSLRSREISVRMAMGALPSGVARLVAQQGAGLAGAGVIVGVIAFVALSQFLRANINGVGRPDVLTIGIVAAVLMVIACAASWIPARRASRIDPARSLSES
jgi:ABC-type antimicrobial peptide transport system permease subunit